ncbi:MAG: hypothetical protein EGQ16_01030 [Clostridiales bacterium]|nr:hypothetical protein [Clostridiales bacterium]
MKRIDDKGITLISLVTTIVILVILASIATYSGIGVIKQTQFTKFSTQLKMMQTQANELYDKYSNNQTIDVAGKKYTGTEIANIGKEISTLSQKTKVFNESASGITDSTGYKYYDKDTIKALNIEGLDEEEYFVNVSKRSVISYDGMEYEGKTYYTIDQLPDGLYNVDYKVNTGKPTFDVNYEKTENNKYKITISNINYDGNIDKWQVKYQKEGQDYWGTSEDYSIIVAEEGKYKIYIENGSIKSAEKEIKVIKLPTGEEKTNTTIQDSLGNQVVVPAGFKIVNPDDNVEDGIIIEDVSHENTKGSQFVWIPVGDVKTRDKGTINIELNRYTFDSNGKETKQGTNKIDNGYTEDTAANHNSSYGNTIAKDIDDFKTKAESSHGYYIGRYEARTTTERYDPTTDDELKQITTKPNDYVYNYVTQPQAAALSRGMYAGTPFESDLVNSYAWDTATLFLQTFGNNPKYSIKTSLNSDGLATQGTNKLDTSKKDKICNVYDMASNYREWSTETCSYGFGPCTRRGGFYDDNSTFTSTRLNYGTTNSFGGTSFRPLLYLKNSTLDGNGLDTITGNETENTTVQDSLGNQVVVPAGFEVVNPNDNVEDGIVVRDKTHTNTAGSEFVWIPVGDVKTKNKGTINIELKRYVFNEDGTVNEELTKIEPGDQLKTSSISGPYYYTEGLKNDETYNTHAKNIVDFKTKAGSSHGYYIGRYEARDKDSTAERTDSSSKTNQLVCTADNYVYNYVKQSQAATLSRGMYTGTPFESDLVNSYAWDTATLFLQTFDNRTNKDTLKVYSRQNSLNTGSLANKGTNNLAEASKIDKICNVYDMASNCIEWSTETFSYNYPCTLRGSNYIPNSAYCCTSYRGSSGTNNRGDNDSFRPILYL